MKNLYLFDIDGTMVDMTSAHVKAYRLAYKKVFGIKVSREALIREFGDVEKAMHEKIFHHYRISGKHKIKLIIDLYTSSLINSFKTANVKVLPGVKKFLKNLKTNGQLLGAVTGNSKIIGQAILKRAKLYNYFDFYIYGGINKRAHIIRKAIVKAKNRKLKFGKVIVIGDAPFDIRAGKANRAMTVAVATGRYNVAELKRENPDLALASLGDYDRILRIA